MNDAKALSERAAATVMDVYPVALVTVHDAQSAISVAPPPQTSVASLVSVGNAHEEGSQMNNAKAPGKHAAEAAPDASAMAQVTVHDAEVTSSIAPLPQTSVAPVVTVGKAHGA